MVGGEGGVEEDLLCWAEGCGGRRGGDTAVWLTGRLDTLGTDRAMLFGIWLSLLLTFRSCI